MKIKFGKYIVKSDSNSYTIIEEGKTKEGEDKENVLGYYSHFDALLKGLVELRLKMSEASSVIELQRDYESIAKDIKEIKQSLTFNE